MKVPISYLENKNSLSGEYLKTFEHIESYCKTKLISESDLEDRLGYLLDIFAAAQADNVPVSSITGESIKDFCHSFLSDSSAAGVFKYIAELLKRISWVAFVLLAINAITAFITDFGNPFAHMMTTTKTASWVIVGAIAGVITVLVSNLIIRSFIFRVKKYRSAYHKIVDTAVYIAIFAGLIAVSMADISLPIPDAVVFAAAAVYLIGFYVIRGIINIKNGKEFMYNGMQTQKVKFSQSVMTQMVGEFREQYDKINNRRERKGKPLFTKEEYLAKIEKDTKTAKVSVIISFAIMAAGYIGGILSVAADSAPSDTAAFALFVVAAFAVCYFLIFHPFVVYPYRIRKRFFDILSASGKTVFDEDVYDCINVYYAENE